MNWFVRENSIVRKIWGKSDTILFIFAGAAAEFALNKAVDWLFFTGRLPADPLGRLFSTVTYARNIVFSTYEDAHAVIDRMASIHHEVESKRKSQIPDWAYRDVLYMLIDYSIRSQELLHRRLSQSEKEEVYDVFRRVGARMGINELPETYSSWIIDRKQHMIQDLERSDYTDRLFSQYKLHLGTIRYQILRAAQGLIVPEEIRTQLNLRSFAAAKGALSLYGVTVKMKLDWSLKKMILPQKYMAQIKALETM